MQLGILFSGQGAQKPGMGCDLLADETFSKTLEQASEAAELDIVKLLKSENGELNQTRYVQPALAAFSLGIWHMLQRDLPNLPAAGMVGLSLGEYPALMAAESLAIDAGFALLKDRGQYMQKAADEVASTLAAVIDPDIAQVEKICAQLPDVWVANYNSPRQLVIGGTQAGIKEAVERLNASQAAKRVIKLNVSGAFHTPLFDGARQQMKARLRDVEFSQPKVPVISNTIVAPFQAKETAAILERQLAVPTHFGQDLQYLIDHQKIEGTLEIGPGKTLSKFAKQVDAGLKREHIETRLDYENFVKEHVQWS